MKMKIVVNSILAAAFLLAGPATQAKDKPVQERGWMGGAYDCARSTRSRSEWWFGADHTLYTFPPALAKTQGAGIFTASLATNTPAYLAGLREGDLILALGGRPVTGLPEFWQAVTGRHPGSLLLVKAYRAGQMVECRVTVGREKYKPLGYFTICLPGFWGPLHPVPTPEAPRFSLMALGYEWPDNQPVEFASVKEQYEHNCHPKDKQTGYDTDWRFWLAIFEVKKGKQIVAQEIVPAAE
jgi:hypothetical protein